MDEVKLVVFDLAGTTVRDRGQVTDAFTAALALHGIAVTPEQLSKVRGSSKREAVLRFIPAGPQRERRAELVYASFRQHLTHSYSSGIEPVDGAAEIFRWLRTRGVRVALNTGFDLDITELLLRALDWKAGVAVDAVVCGDDVRQGRPAPYLIFRAMELTGTMSVHSVANVGDTVLDLEAGHNAGVRWNMGVLSGAHDRHLLESVPHTHILRSITELTDMRFY